MGWMKTGAPDADGLYAVVVGYSDSVMTTMNYTVEGGWNTHRDSDGVVDAENQIDNSDGYIKAWFNVPPYKEKR